MTYFWGGMKRLHNTEDRRVLMERMKADSRPRTTLSFYRYVHLDRPERTRAELYAAWSELEVLGRTYVAKEGINAQISMPTERFEEFKAHIEGLGWLPNLRLNVAVEQGKSFFKLIVRVREKIVADGLADGTFDVTDCGKHLKASEFNALTDQEDTVLIDMRNAYESEVGHFEGAVCPDVNTFREEIDYVEDMLQDQKDANIVMYCTGGIRCEKASSYLIHQGFKHVNQLNGGIIQYALDVKSKGLKSKFIGIFKFYTLHHSFLSRLFHSSNVRALLLFLTFFFGFDDFLFLFVSDCSGGAKLAIIEDICCINFGNPCNIF